MPLNDTTIRGIRPPEKGQKDYIDQHGLTLRVSQGGRKSWVFRHGAAGHRITIGAYPAISLAAARQRAREFSAEITLGQHKQKSLSFAEALDLFIQAHLKAKNRESTAKESERLLRKCQHRFGTTALSDLNASNIAAFLDRLNATPSEANHTYVALKTFFNFAFRRGYIDASPVARLQKPHKAVSRDRVLSPAELRSVLLAAQKAGEYGRFILMLAASGQRVAQIRALDNSHVDRQAKTLAWPAAEMKSNAASVIPYSSFIEKLLEPGARFYYAHQNHGALITASGVPHFTRHDLRRSAATIMGGSPINCPPHLIEVWLARKNGAALGGSIGRIYNKNRYTEELRGYCTAYEAYLAELAARA